MDFYTLFQITIVSVAATSAMTLFSYIISEKFRKLYKEPVLLTLLLTKTKLKFSSQTKKILAWLIHYFIGFVFVLAYQLVWVNPFSDISIISGLLLGCITGVIGIIGWMLLFKIADYQPKINFHSLEKYIDMLQLATQDGESRVSVVAINVFGLSTSEEA
jgi:hypothetical protein